METVSTGLEKPQDSAIQVEAPSPRMSQQGGPLRGPFMVDGALSQINYPGSCNGEADLEPASLSASPGLPLQGAACSPPPALPCPAQGLSLPALLSAQRVPAVLGSHAPAILLGRGPKSLLGFGRAGTWGTCWEGGRREGRRLSPQAAGEGLPPRLDGGGGGASGAGSRLRWEAGSESSQVSRRC